MNMWTWLRAEWDRVAGFGLILLGAVVLYLGYRGVRTSPFLAEELAYIASGGLGGLFCLGFGVGLLLSADLHDEWYKLDRIEAAIRGESLPDATTILNLRASEEADDRGSRTNRRTSSAAGRTSQVTAAVALDAARAGQPAAGSLALGMNWGRTHRPPAVALLALMLLLPLMLSTAGWRRASTTADLNVATDGLVLAAIGTVIALAAVAGYTFWLRARLVTRESRVFRDYLLRHGLAQLRGEEERPASPVPDPAERNGSIGDKVVVAPGLRRFHRPACPAVAGIEVTTVARTALPDGHSACGICGA